MGGEIVSGSKDSTALTSDEQRFLEFFQRFKNIQLQDLKMVIDANESENQRQFEAFKIRQEAEDKNRTLKHEQEKDRFRLRSLTHRHLLFMGWVFLLVIGLATVWTLYKQQYSVTAIIISHSALAAGGYAVGRQVRSESKQGD